MRRGYYGRRRQWRLGTFLVIILLIAVFLVSCMAGGDVLWVRGFFGWDSEALAEEEAIATLDVSGDVARQLGESILSVVGDHTTLYAFSTAQEAAALYRGAVLNTMLLENYSAYTGNSALLEKAAEEYPRVGLVTLIPKEDLEARLTRLFGGGGIGHKSAGTFEYLDRVGMYTTAVQAREERARLSPISLEETEHSYRMRFVLSIGRETSETYTAIFEKCEGGTGNWKMLKCE